MALGTPVVATNIPGYASVVTHGEDGLLVPPRNYNELSEALLTMLRDSELSIRMGENGKAKAKGYSWDIVACQVMDYYQKIYRQVRGRDCP